MSKFKAGDIVQRITSTQIFSCGRIVRGQEYTVSDVISDKMFTLKEFGDFTWSPHSFAKVMSKQVEYNKPKQVPHKWEKEIVAWAGGAKIECRWKNADGPWSAWMEVAHPQWATVDTIEYRIAPEKKPDVVNFVRIQQGTTSFPIVVEHSGLHNVKIVFDGDTGELKYVERL